MRTLILLLAACAGDKDPTTDTASPPGDDDDDDDDTVGPTGDTGGPPQTYPATWDGVEQLFVDHCDRCHPSRQGVDLHTAVPNPPYPMYPYVVPGDPDGSYLWQVVSGNSILMMPQDGLLPIETVQCIYDWIAAGASFD